MRPLSLLLCLLLLVQQLHASSLVFGANTSDRSISTGTNLNTLTTFTWLVWLRPTTLTAGRRFVSKDSQRAAWVAGGSGDQFRAEVGRATTWADTLTTGVGLTTNTWRCAMITYNETDGLKIFVGSETAGLAEASYSSQTVGAGSTLSDNGQGLTIGNGNTFTVAFQGSIFAVAYFDVNLTTSEGDIYKTYFHPYAIEVRRGNIRFMSVLGRGAATVLDWSGNGYNGTVTGATLGTLAPSGVEYYTPGTLSIARALRGLWQTFFFSHLPAEV